jgi:catechol 2,3-dioxygenase-like lactoylglutathione lyase family enzyme
MTFHRGRLIDHVHLRAKDLAASKRFYEGALAVLDLEIQASNNEFFYLDELFVSTADADTPPTHVHLAFQAKDRATVDAFHKAALAVGGRDNGRPGERFYHPGYYAAFVFDPDGNNIEAVYHGPSTRSAESVEFDPA